MKKIIPIVLILIFMASCAPVMVQNNFHFGNAMAQKGLWKEALYRWEKELAQGKETAALHNNIGIALESLGRIDEALEAYRKALKLEPDHPVINKNYDKCKSIQEKIK